MPLCGNTLSRASPNAGQSFYKTTLNMTDLDEEGNMGKWARYAKTEEFLNNLHCSHAERWIKGCEGRYSVTANGEVVSWIGKEPKRLSGAIIYDSERGIHTYRVATYNSNEERSNPCTKSKYHHRAVAEAFLPKVEGKEYVNHKDGDRLNNYASNLEWVTASENTTHAYERGAFVSRQLTDENLAYRADRFLLQGDTSGVDPQHARSLLRKEDLERNGVPPEMLDVSLKGHLGFNPLVCWNYFIDLFRLCDDKSVKLLVIAKMAGISESGVSRIRKGERLQAARKVYDKYKDNPKYLKNYSKVL